MYTATALMHNPTITNQSACSGGNWHLGREPPFSSRPAWVYSSQVSNELYVPPAASKPRGPGHVLLSEIRAMLARPPLPDGNQSFPQRVHKVRLVGQPPRSCPAPALLPAPAIALHQTT
ncbi:COP9 signalosome complex subunit 3 [Platysternon megacephalum]|uniref:COP9 signalosome complex subunit 3 n=1 Tax=Platysternon megacephalum TaxID=55544 RepID=A0A4D9EYW7_9SAUR|nr:COP9 signalosome complex subunit 3 [Platysternon megacephalum]